MKRNTLAGAFIFVLACGMLSSCSRSSVSVASTFWRYTDEDLSYEILFKPDGHVYSYHPGDASPENDFWKQRGKRIRITMNDRYATYTGKLINDSTLAGKAHSKGFRWKWRAKFVTKN